MAVTPISNGHYYASPKGFSDIEILRVIGFDVGTPKVWRVGSTKAADLDQFEFFAKLPELQHYQNLQTNSSSVSLEGRSKNNRHRYYIRVKRKTK